MDGWLGGMNTNDPKGGRMYKISANPHPQPRMPTKSSVPPTPAEEGASSVRWERQGVLRRLVKAS
jgi:hypothetical protein